MLYSRYIGVMRGNGIHGATAHNGYLDGSTPEEYAASLLNAAATPPSLAERYGTGNITVCHSETVGKREVGRVSAKYKARLADWFAGGTKHPAYYAFSHLDNANLDYENEDEGIQTWNFLIGAHAYGIAFGVDVDCLRTKSYDNLFLAGKHIGVAHEVVGFIRMRADMERCGEAAAVMAGCYLKQGVIDYADVRKELEGRGVLKKEDDLGVCNLNYPENGGFQRRLIPQTTEEVLSALSTDEPELGYIGAMKNAEACRSGLLSRIENAEGELRENIAVALGLLGEKGATPYLLEILQRPAKLRIRRDDGSVMFPWLKETVHCNYAKALCLMNRLGAEYPAIAEQICKDDARAVVTEIPEAYREEYRKIIFAFAKKYVDEKRRSIL